MILVDFQICIIDVFIAKFEQISPIVLEFLLLTLKKSTINLPIHKFMLFYKLKFVNLRNCIKNIYDFANSNVFLLLNKRLKSSRLQMFFNNGVLRNFVHFSGKHQCWNLFLNKLY